MVLQVMVVVVVVVALRAGLLKACRNMGLSRKRQCGYQNHPGTSPHEFLAGRQTATQLVSARGDYYDHDYCHYYYL